MATLESKHMYSRSKAREKMKKLFPNLTRKQVIHHVDQNPLNNDVNNLKVMSCSKHLRLHRRELPPMPIKRKKGFETIAIRNIPLDLWHRVKAEAKEKGMILHRYVALLLEKGMRGEDKDDEK